MVEPEKLVPKVCEVRAYQAAHKLRILNNGVLLAPGLTLAPEAVDDASWVARTASTLEMISLLCPGNGTVVQQLDLGKLICPTECAGPEKTTPSFIDCPMTGESVYVG